MHPQLQFALDCGYVEPVKIATESNPEGEPLIINGHNYFVYTNKGEKLTQSRLYAFSDFLDESNRFVAKKEDLHAGMQLIDEVLTEALMVVNTEPKDCLDLIMQAKYRAQTIKQRLNIGASIERIWEISAIWFLRDDDDPEINDPMINQKKVADFKTRQELIGFFQRWAKNVWNPLPVSLDTSLLNAIRDLNLSEILQNQIFTQSQSGVYSKISSELRDSLNSQTETWANVNDTLEHLPTSSIN
ncbi:hypothetical protein GCM10007423_39940 [Dyadobacter endophyticus]|uniref:Uncharacterized protein n=1 Tax=Dyadobacter endophyticus TaxID=1749036 RepID=A0ABQ1YYD5_9BACT|nr:hypothetical protein [Dyadobacter endophyticus]GGH42939.1 hypothetical protein GCM10007423_39940 [Dyadobacter endophyticus]